MPEGSVGVVVSDPAAVNLVRYLNKTRTELSQVVEKGGRGARIERVRLDRLTEVELAFRAALMDKTLNTPEEGPE